MPPLSHWAFPLVLSASGACSGNAEQAPGSLTAVSSHSHAAGAHIQTRGADVELLASVDRVDTAGPAGAAPLAQLSTSLGPFSMIMASDTQSCRTENGYDDCTLNAKRLTAAAADMNAVGGKPWVTGGAAKVPTPFGLVLNGDITEYFTPAQIKQFDDAFYKKLNTKLQTNFYPGLGNHDIQNNMCLKDASGKHVLDKQRKQQGGHAFVDMHGFLGGHNSNARGAVRWMEVRLGDTRYGGKVYELNGKVHRIPHIPKGPDGELIKDTGTSGKHSLAYAFDINNYRFFQFHNYPSYDGQQGKEFNNLSIYYKDSLSWLRTQIPAATKAGKKIVINFHDGTDHPADLNEIAKLAETNNIVAVFLGHTHALTHSKNQPIMADSTGKKRAPIFQSGAVFSNTFMVAEFADDHFRVANVGVDGNPVEDRYFELSGSGNKSSPFRPSWMKCKKGLLYGESQGGFCCDGTLTEGGGNCSGNVCAIDPTRTSYALAKCG